MFDQSSEGIFVGEWNSKTILLTHQQLLLMRELTKNTTKERYVGVQEYRCVSKTECRSLRKAKWICVNVKQKVGVYIKQNVCVCM